MNIINLINPINPPSPEFRMFSHVVVAAAVVVDGTVAFSNTLVLKHLLMVLLPSKTLLMMVLLPSKTLLLMVLLRKNDSPNKKWQSIIFFQSVI